MAPTTVAEVKRPDIQPYLKPIRRKCEQVARYNEGYVDVYDLVQEVAVWWYTVKPELLWTYLTDEKKNRLYRCVFRVARDYAAKERLARGGGTAFVQARYSPMEVMKLIPVAIDPDGLPDGGGIKEGPQAHGNLAEGGDVIASLIDVRRALKALPDGDLAEVYRIHTCRWNYDVIALLDGIEPDSVRRRIARIAQRCADWLNAEEEDE